jgi:hypothetical protein
MDDECWLQETGQWRRRSPTLAVGYIYTHAQGSMTTAKSPAGQERVESVGQVKVAAKYAEMHGKPKPVSLVPAAKHKTGPLATHIDNLGLSLADRPRWNPKS